MKSVAIRCSLLLLCAPALLSAKPSGIEENKTLRASIQKWIAVMQEIQTKQQDWREQKLILEGTKDSLASEKVQLESEIQDAEKRLKNADQESKDKLSEKEEFDAARKAFREELDRLDAKVSAVLPLLPKELKEQQKLTKAIADHRKFVATEKKDTLGLNKRLMAMLTILNEAEKFNQVVTPFTGRTAESNGEKMVLDGAFFGLATGFAANETGTVAFRLKPGANGWVEEELQGKEIAKKVRELIDVANASGEVRLVDVPFEVAP